MAAQGSGGRQQRLPQQQQQQKTANTHHDMTVQLFEPAMAVLSGTDAIEKVGELWTTEFRTRLVMMSLFVFSAATGVMMIALYNDGEVDRDQLKIYLYLMLGLKSAHLIGEMLTGLYLVVNLLAVDLIDSSKKPDAQAALSQFRYSLFTHRGYQWIAMASVYVSYLTVTLKFCDHDLLGILNRYYLCVIPIVLAMVLSAVWFIANYFSSGRPRKEATV